MHLTFISINLQSATYSRDTLPELLQVLYLPKVPYSDKQALANSVDPDQMPQNAESDQGLHCFPVIQQVFAHRQVVRRTYSEF